MTRSADILEFRRSANDDVLRLADESRSKLDLMKSDLRHTEEVPLDPHLYLGHIEEERNNGFADIMDTVTRTGIFILITTSAGIMLANLVLAAIK